MQRVAVIGSNSFSGSDFIDLLLEHGEYEVIGISRSPEKSDLYLPYKKRVDGRFSFHRLDLNHDGDALAALLDTFAPRYAVNFAAQSEVAPSWASPEQWFQTNTVALATLLKNLSRRSYLERYVHISSPEVYGTCQGRVTEEAPLNPSTPYAASKAAADLLLSAYAKTVGFPVVTIRATNVYGAHQQLWKIIPRAAIYLKKGIRIPLHGGGRAVKSYIHIRDVSRGELAAMERGNVSSIYHLAPDGGYAVADVVRAICERMGREFEASTDIVGERQGQDAAYVVDATRAREELGWRPEVGLGEGLDEVVAWVESEWSRIQAETLEYEHRP